MRMTTLLSKLTFGKWFAKFKIATDYGERSLKNEFKLHEIKFKEVKRNYILFMKKRGIKMYLYTWKTFSGTWTNDDCSTNG